MGSVAIGALAALIGVLSGQGMAAALRSGKLGKRIDLIEQAIPELITRAEVQSAFQQVAQIEAQRMQQEQAARAQARQSQVFNTERIDKASAMNQQINEQLAALGERMAAINNQFGVEG